MLSHSSTKTLIMHRRVVIVLAYFSCHTYGTAQRQLDTHTRAAGWTLLGEDYIMHSIFKWTPVMYVPASGELSGVCTCEHYIILYEFLNEIYCVYTMNSWILSLHVLIDPWIHCPTEKLLACSHDISYPTVWPGVENGFCVENRFFIGDWISINVFKFVQSVYWKVRKFQY